ncbi:MAG: TonB-dependent receptor domain-containing protein [Flavobacteriales bacterium]
MSVRRIIIILLTLFPFFTKGQNSIEVTGKILDKATNSPIEFATIVAKNKTNKTVLEGTTTNVDGYFELQINATLVEFEISFIGYETKTISDFENKNSKIALGNILLGPDNKMLGTVELETEQSQTTFRVDKRVFNVGKDLTSQGASALEVLNNVPSVDVDIEGQISLRGSSGVQMLINGKPSVILSNGGNALGSLTADMIERIEVITNPSAKYDAEGTSGIINIVLKKEEKKGINGSITLNTGYPNNHSIGLSLNKRTEKFNFFSQIGIGYRTFLRESESTNEDFSTNSKLTTDGESDKNEEFYNIVLGTDYHLNKRNIITLSGNFAYEKEAEGSENIYNLTNASSPQNSWDRNEITDATNPKWQYELQYKKDFKRNKKQSLLISAIGSYFGKDKHSDFENKRITGDSEDAFQRTSTKFKELENTLKVDYTHPFLEDFEIETGMQYVYNDVSNDYEVNNLQDGTFVIDSNFTNVFEFNQNVFGSYITGSYDGTLWGLKAGLRVENTDVKTELKNNNQKKNTNYTNFFPSFHTSYKTSDELSFQFGYSRRIFRPSLWDLNPFFSFRDNYNISTGNPNLDPEYTNSLELTGIYIQKKYSLNFGVYQRRTTDVIESIRTFENNITTRQPENIGKNTTTGVEMNVKITPSKRIVVLADFNLNHFNRTGSFDNQNFDFTGSRWTSKITLKLKLPKHLDVEFTGNLRSRYKTVQGNTLATSFMNLGLRKKIMKGKVIVNLSVRDVFETRRRALEFRDTQNSLSSLSERGRRIIFGISYGFGKGEAMEFSGSKRF